MRAVKRPDGRTVFAGPQRELSRRFLLSLNDYDSPFVALPQILV